MKLLSPNETKEKGREEVTRNILRTQESRKAEQEARVRLQKTEADFDLMLEGQRLRFQREEGEYKKNLKKILKETEEAEKRRAEALKPIKELEDKARNELIKAQNYSLELQKKEEDLEDLKDKLEDKLDETEAKKEDLDFREKKIKSKEIALGEQESLTKSNITVLNNAMAEFRQEQLVWEKIRDKENREIKMEKLSLEAEKEAIKTEKETLGKMRAKLADERYNLNLGWEELRKERIKYPPINKP